MKDNNSFKKKNDSKHSFLNHLTKNKESQIIVGLITVFCLLILFFVVPKIRYNIKTKQVESLIMKKYSGDKIALISTGKLDKVITEKKDLMILFLDNNDADYPKAEKILSDSNQMKNFSNTLYIYPMVYDKQEMRKKYNIGEGSIIVYFEEGKEKTRLSFTEVPALRTDLINQLNSLPTGYKEPDVPEGPELPEELKKQDETDSSNEGVVSTEPQG